MLFLWKDRKTPIIHERSSCLLSSFFHCNRFYDYDYLIINSKYVFNSLKAMLPSGCLLHQTVINSLAAGADLQRLRFLAIGKPYNQVYLWDIGQLSHHPVYCAHVKKAAGAGFHPARASTWLHKSITRRKSKWRADLKKSSDKTIDVGECCPPGLNDGPGASLHPVSAGADAGG